MNEDEIRREAYRIAGNNLFNLDDDSVWEALDPDVDDEDASEIYTTVRGIGEELLELADDPSEWEDEDGEAITLTPKGFIALMLIDYVPGLSDEDAGELVTDLIERAVDRADLQLGG
jgi:hypothetical protein